MGLVNRRYPIGAEVSSAGVSFRVWAPKHKQVTVVMEAGRGPTELVLTPEPDGEGYFSGVAANGQAGMRYRFRLDNESKLFPDPASRFQPEGPHGPSQVVDPHTYHWNDSQWTGAPADQPHVVYEMHIGTFTKAGTWRAAEERLSHLAELGITLLEVMPVADFVGQFGWGYDGVNHFAPSRLYGVPDDFRRFVDRAHSLKLGVILDVVYNHFGPDGNYLAEFSETYTTDKHLNDWGKGINFDDRASQPVREFAVSNAAYWIDEFHLDGLRLDATQDIHDETTPHILAEITAKVRTTAGKRSTFVVAENEPQEVCHVMPLESGGYGMDALWNDDLHHTAMVALSGHSEAYYTDYKGTPQEFISAFKWGYLYQGQRYKWQKKRRGTSTRHTNPANFVTFLQNHDQIANSGGGQRCHQLADPGTFRAMTAMMLLAPGTPMLFQGQEFAASSPFFYFADHQPELAKLVAEGRLKFLSQFPSLATEGMQDSVPIPAERETYERCQLDWDECETHAPTLQMHRDLLWLRRKDPVLSRQSRDFDGAVLGEEALLLRFFGEESDRLLLVNLGRDLPLDPCPEPLLAEPGGEAWQTLWCSDDPLYGGLGNRPLVRDDNWFLPGHAAVLLTASHKPGKIETPTTPDAETEPS